MLPIIILETAGTTTRRHQALDAIVRGDAADDYEQRFARAVRFSIGWEHYTSCFQKIVVSQGVPSGNSA
jgi:hypothetical protein